MGADKTEAVGMNETSSAPFSLKRSVAELAEPWRGEVRARLEYLERILYSYSFELRDDSRLAFLWATGRLHCSWDAMEVCHEMMSIQFICANTLYTDLSQPFLRCLAKGLKEKYKLKSWSTTWNIVREYGPDILKLICLVDSGVQIPNFVFYAGEAAPSAEDAGMETAEGAADE